MLSWYVESILEGDTRLGEKQVLWVGPCTPSGLPWAVPCEVLAVPKSLLRAPFVPRVPPASVSSCWQDGSPHSPVGSTPHMVGPKFCRWQAFRAHVSVGGGQGLWKIFFF